MEHRLSKRTTLTMDVAIYRDGMDVRPGRALNISRNGIFIQIDPSILPRYSLVEVDLRRYSPSNADITPRRAFAMVVWCAEQGIGLTFADEVVFV